MLSFTKQLPDLQRQNVDPLSCAVACLLALSALPRIGFLFISSWFTLAASSPQLVAFLQLRFASIMRITFREDSHLQDSTHAGRTCLRRMLLCMTDWEHSARVVCTELTPIPPDAILISPPMLFYSIPVRSCNKIK